MITSATRGTTKLLETWATLLPGQYHWLTVDNVDDLYTDKLKDTGLTCAMWHPTEELTALVSTQPSWFLPPMHPAFTFEEAEPLLCPSQERYDLWLEMEGNSHIDETYFDQLFYTRMQRNWWLRYLPGAAERLKERLKATGPLLPALWRVITERYGATSAQEIVSVILTGSFLWSEEVQQGIDAAVIIESSQPATQYCFDHHSEIILQEPLVVNGKTVTHLDLLVISTDCLENPAALHGTIGQWLTSDGDVFPHDLKKRTVYSATQQTYAAGIPIYGRDYYQQVQQKPHNLLALAYYFTQVASALLLYREGCVKAAKRLLESNLILRHWEEVTGKTLTSKTRNILDRCVTTLRTALSDPESPQTLAELQGWWGRESKSLLDLTVTRLVEAHCASQVEKPLTSSREHSWPFAKQFLPGSDLRAAERTLLIPFMELLNAELAAQRVYERCKVASRQQEPAWKVLLAKLEHTAYAADIATLVYMLSKHPEEENDRHIVAEIQMDDSTQHFVIQGVTLDSEEILREALWLYERYRLLLPRSHYFSDTSFIDIIAEYERATELCALINGFLGNTPLWRWLSEPLENLSYGVDHVQLALRTAQTRYFLRFSDFNRRQENAHQHPARYPYLRTAY